MPVGSTVTSRQPPSANLRRCKASNPRTVVFLVLFAQGPGTQRFLLVPGKMDPTALDQVDADAPSKLQNQLESNKVRRGQEHQATMEKAGEALKQRAEGSRFSTGFER